MKTTTHSSTEKFTAGNHTSYWTQSIAPIVYNQLGMDKETDVVIVGGGMAGVSIAYCLTQQGKKVILVEDGFIGSGETGRTTAHLVTALDDRDYELERLFGKEDTKLIAESHAAAIDFIEKTIQKEAIACEFERVDGYLFLHPTDEEESLDKELEACQRAGMSVDIVNEIPGISAVSRALRFKNQAQFHPLNYLKALCEAIVNRGGEIYTNTHALDITDSGIKTSDGFTIKAKHIVVATNTPVNNKVVMHLKQYAYRTYVIGYKVKKDALPTALWWDTGDYDMNEEIAPYHYVRKQTLNNTHDLLLIGGEDHATGLADAENRPEEDRYEALTTWTKKHFPQVEDMVYKWSGQVMEPMDSLAYIGRNPYDKNNVYIVTGDSGNGMTHATIAGILITDLILEKENVWENIYSPSRLKIFKAGKTFFKEFVGGLMSYIKTKPKHLKDTAIDSISKNEGKIIELDGQKYGAYRDEQDNIHFVAAECTHQGCLVKFNGDEKSWDCPCHGSRFTHEGEILNGPANKPLLYYKENVPLIKE